MRPAGHIENGVMFGSDGYLFLLDGGHHVFDLLLGLRKVAEQSYANFADNISRRAAICQRAESAIFTSFTRTSTPSSLSNSRSRIRFGSRNRISIGVRNCANGCFIRVLFSSRPSRRLF